MSLPNVSPFLPEVRAGFLVFTRRFEGSIAWMYCDEIGLVTTAIGCLIDPIALTMNLPWRDRDGNEASKEDIASDWQRVKNMGGDLVASRYRTGASLELSEEAIVALVMQRVDQSGKRLLVHFPDLASWPAAAQTALLSMAWALGPDFSPKWPHFTAAALRRDWVTCAKECVIPRKDHDRNMANVALFEQAASGG